MTVRRNVAGILNVPQSFQFDLLIILTIIFTAEPLGGARGLFIFPGRMMKENKKFGRTNKWKFVPVSIKGFKPPACFGFSQNSFGPLTNFKKWVSPDLRSGQCRPTDLHTVQNRDCELISGWVGGWEKRGRRGWSPPPRASARAAAAAAE